MPLTGAERSKNHRKKLNANAEMYEAYKEKDRVQKRESRMKTPSCSPRKAAAERRKCRERVRIHRLRKKLSTSQDALNSKFLPTAVYQQS